MKFEELQLEPSLLEAISYMGFEVATPIQEAAIPKILAGEDILACAQTGTGKTAAFILPVLHQLSQKSRSNTIDTLIIVPTRELAQQIDRQIQGFAYFVPISSHAIYGGGSGQDFEQDKAALKRGAEIIVATPGKLISHLNMGYVNFKQVKYLILDEADRMLDMGFSEDVQKIISFLPKERQNLMFSATMPPKIRKFAHQILQEPQEINLALSKPAEGVLQAVYPVYNYQKTPLISSLIRDKPNFRSILIFSSTKKQVAEIAREMKKQDFNVAAISSDLPQKDRDEVLRQFRARNIRILVATDVMSRGIDIKEINLIVNYNVPSDAEDYVHRVGRTARADASGVAITLVNPEDMMSMENIEKLIERKVIRIPVPAHLGKSPKWEAKRSYRKKLDYSRQGKRRGRRNYRKR